MLEQIHSPEDIQALDENELNQLAAEIRKYLLEVVSANGGHLASNLGVVELTLALHSVFDFSKDKLVLDVGHQCYTHKILTGRKEEMVTLRQQGGISGFPKSSESTYDHFNTGHSSTSISAAIGMAKARDIKNENYSVVAVIGDGALTGGMAFEALNHSGYLNTPLIIILNDNKMSIAKNVGAMSRHLNKLRTSPQYGKSKATINSWLRKIPKIGGHIANGVERLKDSVKYLLVPGILFEEMNFTYLGPIDGHDIAGMQEIFRNAKNLNHPVIIHVLTQKGRGYLPAEKQPDKFHGTPPFDILTGKAEKEEDRGLTYTQAFGQTMIELAEQYEDIVAITAAMPDGTGLKQFGEVYPERFFDVGIAEQHAVTFGAGLAANGLRPVVAIYSTFLQRAYDQVWHDVCLQDLPVIFALDRGGLVPGDGETHQGIYDLSYLRTMPNLTIMAPKDENELRQMLYTAYQQNHPVAIRYPRGYGMNVALEPFHEIPWGKWETITHGEDLMILAVGPLCDVAMEVRRILYYRDISVTIINARFLKPLDEGLLTEIAAAHCPVAILEENVCEGGLAGACAEYWSRNGLQVDTLSFALPDVVQGQGSVETLRAQYGLKPETVAENILAKWFSGKEIG